MYNLQVLATLIGNHFTRKPTASLVLTKCWKWELMLTTNFGNQCQTVTKFGSQNFGYQIWFCTRLFTKVSLKITYLKLNWILPGAKELSVKITSPHWNFTCPHWLLPAGGPVWMSWTAGVISQGIIMPRHQKWILHPFCFIAPAWQYCQRNLLQQL